MPTMADIPGRGRSPMTMAGPASMWRVRPSPSTTVMAEPGAAVRPKAPTMNSRNVAYISNPPHGPPPDQSPKTCRRSPGLADVVHGVPVWRVW